MKNNIKIEHVRTNLVALAKKVKKKGASSIQWIQEQSRDLKIIKSTINNFMSLNLNLHKR